MNLGVSRKWVYATILIGYYVFIVVFGLRTGLVVTTSTLLVGGISYAWFLFAISRGGYVLVDRKDLAVNLIFYLSISLLVIFVDWQVSLAFYKQFNELKLLLSLPSVVLWVGIWLDFYRQRMKGNM